MIPRKKPLPVQATVPVLPEQALSRPVNSQEAMNRAAEVGPHGMVSNYGMRQSEAKRLGAGLKKKVRVFPQPF